MGLGVAGKDSFRFLQVSTGEVYGSLVPTGRFTETSPYAPNSPYAASKAAADHLVRAWYHTYGLPVLTTNCSNNYGPYQFPEKLIPLVILKALQGERLPVYGDGSNVRDWLYVGDHCRAIRRVLEAGRPGQVYGVGEGGSVPTCRLWTPSADCSMSSCPTRPTDPTAGSKRSSPTGRGTTGATPSTRTSCGPSWDGSRGSTSRAGCGGRWSGISKIRHGADVSWTAAIGASVSESPHEP